MSTDPITLYAIGEAVAKRVMFDIESGEWVVAINVNDDENDNENGKGGLVDCEVYFTEAVYLTMIRSEAPSTEIGAGPPSI